MTQENSKTKFDHGSFQIVLDSMGEEPVQIEAGSWRGVNHVGLRQLFRGKDGKLYYGKQGFNCPVDDIPHLIVALLECYNKSTGNMLSLHAGDETGEEDVYEIYERVVKGEMIEVAEPVFSWSKGN